EDALEQLTSAADEATTAKDRMRAELLYIATARASLDSRPLARERVRKLAAEVDSAPDGFDRDVFAELAYEECLAGAPKDGVVALVRRALGGSALDGVHDLEPATLHVAALSLVWCGELRDAERVARVTLARASRRGN